MLPENRIKLRSATACAIALMLPACATLPKKEFVPVDPEMLVEWSVEGAIEISDNSGNDNAHFLFENIPEQTEVPQSYNSNKNFQL